MDLTRFIIRFWRSSEDHKSDGQTRYLGPLKGDRNLGPAPTGQFRLLRCGWRPDCPLRRLSGRRVRERSFWPCTFMSWCCGQYTRLNLGNQLKRSTPVYHEGGNILQYITHGIYIEYYFHYILWVSLIMRVCNIITNESERYKWCLASDIYIYVCMYIRI